jgi:formylglycine-generating enzyme required for sulfatase activity
MRLAEHGLRKLAKRVHVTLNHKGKNYPVEYADWEAVITAIKNKITQSRQIPRGPKKVEELRFYSSAADQCEYMKDIWRNEISHTRRQYSKPESLAVINRVREFIESLSKP